MAGTLIAVAPVDRDAVLPLARAKDQVKVEGDDENELIAGLRDAAVDWVERYTGKALQPTEFTWTIDGFDERLRPPVAPIRSVSGITYVQTSGSTDLDNGAWRELGDEVLPAIGASWPCLAQQSPGAVRIKLIAGYEDVAAEAPALVAAAAMMFAHLYRNREAIILGPVVTEAPLGVTSLCAAFRKPVFA